MDIIIGTPGRLLDYAQSKKLRFNEVNILVIDEADRLFDMGFLPDLKKMLRQMAKPQDRQTMLFSATLGTRVAHLAWDFMNRAEEIVIDNDRVTVDEITQELYHTSNQEKFKLLLGLLGHETPSNAIIFSNTKDMAVKLAKRLELNGYHAEYIMGDLPQRKRQSIINRIKEGKLEILVATDVAARGLHINDLDLVINYDIPEDSENYVHRIGRTARAGKSGKAITLACEKYVYGLEAIHDFIGIKIPVVWPEESFLDVEDKSKGVRISSGSSQGRSPSRTPRRSGGSRSRSAGSTDRSSRSRAGTRSPQNSSKDANSSRPKTSPKSRPQKPRTQEKKQPAAQTAKPNTHADLESRLEYYRKKYGEDFELTATTGSEHKSESSRKPKPSRQGHPGSRPQHTAPDTQKTQETEAEKPGLLKRLFNKMKS